jgi:NTP pyrophosphatase (non-canonical NTP hydrolase)
VTNSELSQFTGISYANAKSKGFFCDSQSDAAYIAAIHEELSEAFRAWNKHEGWINVEPKPSGVYFELVDAVIRVFSFCGYKGINLFEYRITTDRPYDQDDLCDLINRSHLSLAQAAEQLERDEFIDDYEEELNQKCIASLLSLFIARIELFIEESFDDLRIEDLIDVKLEYNKTRGMKHGGHEV